MSVVPSQKLAFERRYCRTASYLIPFKDSIIALNYLLLGGIFLLVINRKSVRHTAGILELFALSLAIGIGQVIAHMKCSVELYTLLCEMLLLRHDAVHVVIAVGLVAAYLFQLTAEVVGVSDLFLVRVDHLQEAVVAVVGPLRHIGGNRLVGHNQRAADLGDFAHLAVEVLDGTHTIIVDRTIKNL